MIHIAACGNTVLSVCIEYKVILILCLLLAQFMLVIVDCSPVLQVFLWQMWGTSIGGILWKATMV